jgi:hypothetical protein
MASALDFLKYFVKFQTRNFIYLEWNFVENSHFLDFHLKSNTTKYFNATSKNLLPIVTIAYIHARVG